MEKPRSDIGALVCRTGPSCHSHEGRSEKVERLRVVVPHPDCLDVKLVVRQCIEVRKARRKFLPEHLFADPAWDMLLELYKAELDQVRISTSNLGDISAVPATTALRWINAMVGDGLIERLADPLDARRIFVQLSENGLRNMVAYFSSIRGSTGA